MIFKRPIFAAVFLFVCGAAHAQINIPSIINVLTDPAGTCASPGTPLQYNTQLNHLSACQGAAPGPYSWALVSGGGGGSGLSGISQMTLSQSGLNGIIGPLCATANAPCIVDVGNGNPVAFSSAATVVPPGSGNSDTWYVYVDKSGTLTLQYTTSTGVSPTSCTTCTIVAGSGAPIGNGNFPVGYFTVVSGAITGFVPENGLQSGPTNVTGGTGVTCTQSASGISCALNTPVAMSAGGTSANNTASLGRIAFSNFSQIILDSNFDDGGTTSNTLTYKGSGGLALTGGPLAVGSGPPAVTGTGIIGLGESTGQACVSGADCIVANSSSHQALLSNNNATAVPIAVTAASTTANNIPTYSGTAGSVLGTGIAPGTGVATALAVNVGSAGAFVTNGGALGTPSGGTLTNATGLPPAGLAADTLTTLTDGATVSYNIGSILNHGATLLFTAHSGSRTLNITNPVIGGNYIVRLKQDATGGEGLTLGSGCTWLVADNGGGAVTLTNAANAVDVLVFYYDGTNCLTNLLPHLN